MHLFIQLVNRRRKQNVATGSSFGRMFAQGKIMQFLNQQMVLFIFADTFDSLVCGAFHVGRRKGLKLARMEELEAGVS